jgi:hypothetical protein
MRKRARSVAAPVSGLILPVHECVGWNLAVTLPMGVPEIVSGGKFTPLVGTVHVPSAATVPVSEIFGFISPRSNERSRTRITPSLTVPVVVIVDPDPVLTLRASAAAGPNATAVSAAATDALSLSARSLNGASACTAGR